MSYVSSQLSLRLQLISLYQSYLVAGPPSHNSFTCHCSSRMPGRVCGFEHLETSFCPTIASLFFIHGFIIPLHGSLDPLLLCSLSPCAADPAMVSSPRTLLAAMNLFTTISILTITFLSQPHGHRWQATSGSYVLTVLHGKPPILA